jgi:AcrR family transcriptional regulator
VNREKKKALRRVTRSAEKSRLAAAERDLAIADALQYASMRQVAESAGLSPARIHQIRHGK